MNFDYVEGSGFNQKSLCELRDLSSTSAKKGGFIFTYSWILSTNYFCNDFCAFAIISQKPSSYSTAEPGFVVDFAIKNQCSSLLMLSWGNFFLIYFSCALKLFEWLPFKQCRILRFLTDLNWRSIWIYFSIGHVKFFKGWIQMSSNAIHTIISDWGKTQVKFRDLVAPLNQYLHMSILKAFVPTKIHFFNLRI